MSKILEQDKKFLWHPFTQHETAEDPIVITKAHGTEIFDETGKAYLDLISSWWTCLHGHAHPVLNKALAKQSQKFSHVMFAGFTHPLAVKLATQLSAHLPHDLNRVFYSDNGSTAVEVAMKIAWQSWQNQGVLERRTFLAFEGAYHGDTVGAMSVGEGSGFFSIYRGMTFDIQLLPYATCWDNDPDAQTKEQQAIERLKDILAKKGSKIAGLIIEPLIQGAGGFRMCSPSFIKAITTLTQAEGIPVIFDEVAVGFGRTGTLFAHEQAQVTPDLLCLSKGLTGGYMPMSVTVAKQSLYEKFLDEDFNRALIHGHSYTANALACAVACASLSLFKTENTLERLQEINKQHRAFLDDFMHIEGVYNTRLCGTILAFEVGEPKHSYTNAKGPKITRWFLEKGFNIRPLGNTVYLMPPYSITNTQLNSAYQALRDGVQSVL